MEFVFCGFGADEEGCGCGYGGEVWETGVGIMLVESNVW